MALAIPTSPRRPLCKASRPALIDLRFKGDAWVVERGTMAAVCLGDFSLGQLAVCALDMPTLNRVFGQVRTGQCRRGYLCRLKRL